ncbi:MAG TPA: N-acetyl-gamma-glutamyl-phosphate reductase [Candidatus Limiplasma sp.]|nr:N-acetyl-gamma-glutamyl-phosphate reductase [Candidatus Limiplasma sp.]
MTKVFINGSSGTTGLRIRDRLQKRANITLLSLPEAQRKDVAAQAALAGQADITILCLPDDASCAFMDALGGAPCKVLDTSTAFRTDDRFAYGFPELSKQHEEAIRNSGLVANTGCHAAGAIALLYPLLTAGVIAADMPLSITSITGYSGGGKKMIADYEADNRDTALDSPRAYAVTQAHKHLPEIVKVCGLTQPPIFQPIVADFYNGMLVGIPLHPSLMRTPLEVDGLTALYRAHFANRPMIRVLDANPEPLIAANTLADSDVMEIFATGAGDRMIVYARFDNLGKGACGMAIQNMDLMIGR